MFLNDDDYKAVCDDFEFETLQANTDLRLTAERAAQEQISSYTRGRYDMARAFRQTGEDRNPQLVQCCVNIALWLMVHRLPQNMGIDGVRAFTTRASNGCVTCKPPRLRPTSPHT